MHTHTHTLTHDTRKLFLSHEGRKCKGLKCKGCKWTCLPQIARADEILLQPSTTHFQLLWDSSCKLIIYCGTHPPELGGHKACRTPSIFFFNLKVFGEAWRKGTRETTRPRVRRDSRTQHVDQSQRAGAGLRVVRGRLASSLEGDNSSCA